MFGNPKTSDKVIRDITTRDWEKPDKTEPARMTNDCSGASLMNFRGVLSNCPSTKLIFQSCQKVVTSFYPSMFGLCDSMCFFNDLLSVSLSC